MGPSIVMGGDIFPAREPDELVCDPVALPWRRLPPAASMASIARVPSAGTTTAAPSSSSAPVYLGNEGGKLYLSPIQFSGEQTVGSIRR